VSIGGPLETGRQLVARRMFFVDVKGSFGGQEVEGEQFRLEKGAFSWIR
jgi:hypothetical protein